MPPLDHAGNHCYVEMSELSLLIEDYKSVNSDISGVAALLGLPDGRELPRCWGAPTLVLASGSRRVAVQPPCRSLRCELCAPRVKYSWGCRVALLMLAEPELYAGEIAECEWGTASKFIRRGKGEYARAGCWTVATSPVGKGRRESIPPEEGVGLLGGALAVLETGDAPRRSRLLRTSWGWQSPPAPKGEYRLVGHRRGASEPKGIVAGLAGRGIEAAVLREPGGSLGARWFVSWSVA